MNEMNKLQYKEPEIKLALFVSESPLASDGGFMGDDDKLSEGDSNGILKTLDLCLND